MSKRGVVPMANGRAIALQVQSEHYWKVKDIVNAAGFKSVSHLTNKAIKNVRIRVNRLNKFKTKMDPERIKSCLVGNKSSCVSGCRKGCSNNYNLLDLINCRLSCFNDSNTEQDVTEHLVRTLKNISRDNIFPTSSFGDGLDVVDPGYGKRKNITYLINDQPVCHVFWAKAYGISEDKMKKVRGMLRNNSSTTQHGNKGTQYHTSQHGLSYAFWHHFFGQNCQQPNDSLRLFPVNNSFRFIYDSYFLSWFNKQQMTMEKLLLEKDPDIEIESMSKPIPSFPVFKKARWHEDFTDVKKRAKHYHCLCKTCDALNTRRLRGFVGDAHKLIWQTLFHAHEAEKLGWRNLEGAREAEVRAAPRTAILLQYDDTGSLGLPKLSNRGIKNCTKSR